LLGIAGFSSLSPSPARQVHRVFISWTMGDNDESFGVQSSFLLGFFEKCN
jgi:hypothetical protein